MKKIVDQVKEKLMQRYMALNRQGEVVGPCAKTIEELVEILVGAHKRVGLSGNWYQIKNDYTIALVEIKVIEEVDVPHPWIYHQKPKGEDNDER